MFSLIAVAAVTMLTLAGCGSNRDSSGSVTGDADDVLASAQAVGITNCAQCHTVYNEKWLAGPHGNADLSPGGGDPHTGTSSCVKCHNPLDDGNLMTIAYGDEEIRDVIGCESCHGGGEFHYGSGPFAAPLPGPAQCGKCHSAETTAGYHSTSIGRIINDTHYDDPATGNVIEGYVVKMNEQTGCQDCHFDGHTLDLEINAQWSESAHAGHLVAVKEAAQDAAEAAELANAVDPANLTEDEEDAIEAAGLAAYLAAGVKDGDKNSAWAHYNWDSTYKADGVEKDRADCQMCHTATGAANFLNDPAMYDEENNSFAHLADWAAAGGSGQNELVYCWTCHKNNQADMRNPGAIPVSYTVAGAAASLPDLGSSNVCANCHAGRGNMDSLVEDFDTNTDGSFKGTAATKTHYKNAAATIFQATVHPGYEYEGLSYADLGWYDHDEVGFVEGRSGPEAEEGPCAGCHMSSAESHTFEVFTKDAAGVITALNSTKCVECHDGEHGPGLVTVDTTTDFGDQTAAAAVAFLEHEAEAYHEALELLEEALAAKGIFFAPAYPYFFGDANDNGVLDEAEINRDNGYAEWDSAGTNGAAHNFNYLHHEMGAYAHNSLYAKRLIFDSIDWLDNGTLDGTITVDAVAYPAAATWLDGDDTVAGNQRPRP
ncbi:multiheme c-type cytochrome [Desulfuromonas sp. AOP6]|uniref:multiheme c-type cytochrome n=1 Tax=Desulfuromonas sp. AOP6 TaxID=1566351 RepID=UPI001BCB2E54|nr:multiheme c-type cytochrome [Desulfuromonas sp. AOP6]